MPIPGSLCDCSECRAERWRAAIYGESAVDHARLEADRASRDLAEMRGSALRKLSESALDRRVREAGEALKDRAWRAYVEHCYDAETARLIDELKQRTQRSSMACNPFSDSTYTIKFNIDPASMFSPSYFNLGGSSMSSSSNDPASPAGLANAVKSLADKDPNADLSGVKATIEGVERERKARIVKALQGMADLEILNGTKAKRFVLTYWRGSETKTAYGTEYPVRRDDDGDPEGYSVYIDDCEHPVLSNRYETMEQLRESLEGSKIPFHIAYFDK
jgi:hypothetical protein